MTRACSASAVDRVPFGPIRAKILACAGVRSSNPAAASRVWSRRWPFQAKRRLAGVRLVATDVAWSAGSGAWVEGPIAALLLTSTGRAAGVPALTGAGVAQLRRGLASCSPAGP